MNKFSKKAFSGKVYGKEIEDFGALEKIIFLKFILPIVIKSYTKLWKEWKTIEKQCMEKAEVIELVQDMMISDGKAFYKD